MAFSARLEKVWNICGDLCSDWICRSKFILGLTPLASVKLCLFISILNLHQQENWSFWQGHLITFRYDLNVEVILADICFTPFYIICRHSGLRNWNYEPPSIGSRLNKRLAFSPPRSPVNRQGSSKAVATQQLWLLSFSFKWIKMKLGDAGHSCGLHLEIWVCPQLYWGQYNFIYRFCLLNS